VIALGAHPYHLFDGWLQESATQELLQDAPCPVLIIQTGEVILS
jgi:nucleotide-binding universal stress UspA family protein